MEVKFYDSVNDALLKFAVIISKHCGKWVLCKHKERDTYEIPGGHREKGESIIETAKRELFEETGAADFGIEPVCVYSATGKNRVNETGEETFGMLFFAEIKAFEHELHSEIEKIYLFDELPEKWTYPDIQPFKMSTEDIENFVSKHEKWIEKNIIKKHEHAERFSLNDEEISVLKKRALPYLTERTEYFSKLMGLEYSGIKITSAKKRFGSCSGRNSICYSWRLMQYPAEAIDYVVVHELAHIVYKNHGKDFYKLIKKILPDYKKRENMLKL